MDSLDIEDDQLYQNNFGNSAAANVIGMKLKSCEDKRHKKKVETDSVQAKKEVNVATAIINLMRICVKREEGSILSQDSEILVRSQLKEILKYLTTGGKGRLVCQLIIAFLSAALEFFCIFWLFMTGVNWVVIGDSKLPNIFIWVGLNILSSALSLLKDFSLRHSLSKNSDAIYRESIQKLVYNTNMKWFKSNSSNKLIYILTDDITNIDDSLNELFSKIVDICFSLLLYFVFNTYLLWLIMTIPFIIGLVFFIPLFSRYMAAMQHFYQEEMKNKSELLAIYVQTHESIINFRNMGYKDFFDAKFIDATENYQRAFTHLNNVCGRWMGVRKMMFNTYLLALVYTIPILIKFTGIGKSSGGWWNDENAYLSMEVATTMKMTALINAYLNSVGNISKYILSAIKLTHFRDHDCIEDDSGSMEKLPDYTSNNNPKDSTGNNNAIVLKNISMNYGFNKKALWDISIGLKPGEKIGLVGMQNSGKNSLFNLLLK